MNNHGKMKKEQMKNGRAYIPSLVIFVGYLRGLSSWVIFRREQKYLPIFAAFCEHKKNAIIRLFVLFCGLME